MKPLAQIFKLASICNISQPPIGIINHSKPYPYGDVKTYELGAEFLKDCSSIEDWGCGRGYFRHHLTDFLKKKGLPGLWMKYKGIDFGVDSNRQAQNHFADVIADLTTYRSDPQPEGIFIRHVLEHNYKWDAILANALNSATKKAYICIYTPMLEDRGIEDRVPEDKVLQLNGPPEYPFYDPPVPNLSLSMRKLMKVLDTARNAGNIERIEITSEEVQHSYGRDWIIYVTKK